jgi:hypothetical protein
LQSCSIRLSGKYRVGFMANNIRAASVRRYGKPARYERHPDEWPIVARILSERVGGASCQRIADGLNDHGIGTPTAHRKEKRGRVSGPGKWSAATVAALCRNRYIRAAAESAEPWDSLEAIAR